MLTGDKHIEEICPSDLLLLIFFNYNVCFLFFEEASKLLSGVYIYVYSLIPHVHNYVCRNIVCYDKNVC